MQVFYRSTDGEVYAYDSEAERDQFGSPDLVRLTQSEEDAYKNPSVTYKEALDSLNSNYQSDVDKFNRSFALAFLADGPSEENKMAVIRAAYEARRVQHTANIAALKLEYGV